MPRLNLALKAFNALFLIHDDETIGYNNGGIIWDADKRDMIAPRHRNDSIAWVNAAFLIR